jgi:hypothetical protein
MVLKQDLISPLIKEGDWKALFFIPDCWVFRCEGVKFKN